MAINLMELHYDNFVKIIPIGRTSVGKSSLLNMYIDERMDHPYRQNFHDFVVKPVKVDGKLLNLNLSDTNGNSMSTYRGALALMLIYDITDVQSFDNLRDNWRISKYEYLNKHVQCILVGNKCDLESKRAVESSTGKEFADSLNIPFIETSAKENINVEQAFVLLAAMIVKKLPETDTSRTKSSRK